MRWLVSQDDVHVLSIGKVQLAGKNTISMRIASQGTLSENGSNSGKYFCSLTMNTSCTGKGVTKSACSARVAAKKNAILLAVVGLEAGARSAEPDGLQLNLLRMPRDKIQATRILERQEKCVNAILRTDCNNGGQPGRFSSLTIGPAPYRARARRGAR